MSCPDSDNSQLYDVSSLIQFTGSPRNWLWYDERACCQCCDGFSAKSVKTTPFQGKARL